VLPLNRSHNKYKKYYESIVINGILLYNLQLLINLINNSTSNNARNNVILINISL